MQFIETNTYPNPTGLTVTHKRILLFFILLGALLLRLQHISQPYTDLAGWRQSSMAMMADNFYHRNANILFPEVSWNGPGESYNGREFQTVTYTSKLLYSVLGQHDWVGRLVAVLFGVWGVFAFYKLVRRIWGDTHGLVCAAMLALLPAAIYFDRSFLPDPAMVSLVITAMWLLIAHLQSGQRRYLLGALFFSCLGFLTKITGMLVLLPMLYAVLAILQARKALSVPSVLRIVGPALFVIAIVAAYYLWARHLSLHYPPYHFAGADNWLWDEGLATWLQQRFFMDDFWFIARVWMWGWPFLILAAAGLVISAFVQYKNRWQFSTEKKNLHAPYLFHYWFVGFVIFYTMGAKELIGNFWNFHIFSPVLAAFSGYA
ncbi:MAG TPA: glycosyltransferase family 39 protein, partial [Chitinophagaceae bacterium]|nr:glycosyltransferase family 39 protein [Chitinophagaceae bacterium]